MIDASVLPPGFHADGDGSGLLVPAELGRKREVCLQEQWKYVTRAIEQFCAPFNFRFMLLCNNPKCPDPTVKRKRQPDGYLFQCGCREVVVSDQIGATRQTHLEAHTTRRMIAQLQTEAAKITKKRKPRLAR